MDHPPDATSLLHHFAALKDPRQRAKVVYPLPEILLLVLCATIVGAEDFVEITQWGAAHMDFLRRFLPYKDGIPSHDALNDLINALNPKLFSECFIAWVCVTATPTLSQSTAKPLAAPMPDPRDATRYTWSPHGPHASGSSSGRKRQTSNPTRSPPSRCCSSGLN